MKKFTLTAALLLLFTTFSFSQDSTRFSTDFKFGCDFMSRYIWRGLNCGGDGPSIQPTLKLDFGTTSHKFTVGAWGAYTFGPTSSQEIDLYAAYTFKELLTLTVTDYFFPGLYGDKRNDYFYYWSDSTGHVYEASVMFNGTRKIPFTFLVATNFYGNDARHLKKINDSTFEEKGIQFSTYLELGFKTSIKGIDFNAFIGGTVNKPDYYPVGTCYYGNTKAGITNVGIKLSKAIPVTEKFSIPVQVSLIANPLQNRFYLVFGFSI